MQDCWIPRLTLVSQVVLLSVCAVLIALGHDSMITDLFCAGAGATLGTHVISTSLKRLSDKGAVEPSATKVESVK